MKPIEIDDQVFAELSRRATGFHVTPNDVLRRILNLESQNILRATSTPVATSPPVASTLGEFLRSETFLRRHQAIDRFLGILSWLQSTHTKNFAEVVLGFGRGKRLYFAKSQREIEESGSGVTAKLIPRSPFWVLTTLDNKSKRIVIEDIMQKLGYSKDDINLVCAELPDSDIRRTHGRVYA